MKFDSNRPLLISPTTAEDRTLLEPVLLAEAVDPQAETLPAGPKFAASASVPKVSSDVAALAKQLEKLDERMHRVFAEVGEWTSDPKETGNKEIENLKRDFGVLGNEVHYLLMTDVSVQYHDDDDGESDPPAPLPKLKTPKPAE